MVNDQANSAAGSDVLSALVQTDTPLTLAGMQLAI